MVFLSRKNETSQGLRSVAGILRRVEPLGED